jgi:hypothetical protein
MWGTKRVSSYVGVGDGRRAAEVGGSSRAADIESVKFGGGGWSFAAGRPEWGRNCGP